MVKVSSIKPAIMTFHRGVGERPLVADPPGNVRMGVRPTRVLIRSTATLRIHFDEI